MNDTTVAIDPAKKNRSVLRTIFALVFGVIGIVSLFVSTLAIWGQATLFDSDRVADAAAEALAAPGATEAIAVYLTDQLVEALRTTGSGLGLCELMHLDSVALRELTS